MISNLDQPAEEGSATRTAFRKLLATAGVGISL